MIFCNFLLQPDGKQGGGDFSQCSVLLLFFILREVTILTNQERHIKMNKEGYNIHSYLKRCLKNIYASRWINIDCGDTNTFSMLMLLTILYGILVLLDI